MKTTRIRVALLAAVALAFALATGSCEGDGSPLLSGYLTQLESLQDEHASRLDSFADYFREESDASTDEEWLAANRAEWSDFVSTSSDFVDRLERLEAPPDAASIHKDLVSANREALTLGRELSDALESAQSKAEAETIADRFADRAINSSDRGFAALCALQELADDKGIEVDLGCAPGPAGASRESISPDAAGARSASTAA